MLELDMKEMAKRLVEARGEKTQDEVARDLGISKSALSMYETGQRIPRDPVKARISAYYNKSIPFLFFNEKEH